MSAKSRDWWNHARLLIHDLTGGTYSTEAHERILAALQTHGPLTSAQIAAKTELGTAQMYFCLLQMEMAGWVNSEWRPGHYPRQRLYRLVADDPVVPQETLLAERAALPWTAGFLRTEAIHSFRQDGFDHAAAERLADDFLMAEECHAKTEQRERLRLIKLISARSRVEPVEWHDVPATIERDLVRNPYSADEQRVVDWLIKRTRGTIGAGDDPIGFVLASYDRVIQERADRRDTYQ